MVELRKSGLTLATMGISGCYSISRREAMAVLGRDPRSGGIAFPYSDTYQRIKLDKPYVDSRTGSDRNVVNRIFHPSLKRAGLRRIRFHDLRHTTASLLIAQGENPKYIQSQMRHASIQTTFDRYGHLFSDTHKEAVARLDATLSASEQ